MESGWRGEPPEIADDLFRAIAPCSVVEFPNGSIAMPLIGAGDQGYAPDLMFESILRAAVAWFRRGLPISVLKIVVYSDRAARLAKQKFVELKSADEAEGEGEHSSRAHEGAAMVTTPGAFDVFLSYAHDDAEPVQQIRHLLARLRPKIRIFYDRQTLSPGASWLTEIAESLDSARRVVALYTPTYWASKYCKDEFAAAYVRQTDTREPILFPIYFRTAKIPYLFRTVEYLDCREGNIESLSAACSEFCAALPLSS